MSDFTQFGDLAIGDIFMYNGAKYVKNTNKTAINSKTLEVIPFEADTLVIPV